MILLKKISVIIIVACLFSCGNKHVKSSTSQVEAVSEENNVEKLAGDFKFTEGPAVDAEGNVYFTDVRAHIIYKWTLEDKLEVFRTESNRANGMYFDKDENLLVCEGSLGRITATTPQGVIIPIATEYNGKKFNQPNDVWSDSKGGVYFTDPKFGGDDADIPQDGMHVYYLNPERNKVIRVCDDFVKPNGVLGTPDGKTLFVADSQGGKTFKYTIQEDGTLTDKTLFVDFGCDGMTLDKQGNIYLTPRKKYTIDVYTQEGKFVKNIKFPEMPSNACFGGKDKNQLFVTARTSIYRIQLDAVGVD